MMALDRAMAEGGVALLDVDSIPHIVIEARAHFLAALNRARNERMDRKAAERAAEYERQRAERAARGE